MINEQETRVRAAVARPGGRRKLLFTAGDRVAFVTGIALTIALLGFFTWRMVGNVTRDRGLGPVPTNVITPPPPPGR